MKHRLIQISEDLQSNFWMYPLIMIIVTMILLVLAIIADHFLAELSLLQNYLNYNIEPTDIKSILTTIITAIITITSVTLSITILTLSIASNQLGPRLLPNFIRQGRTQFVIGSFFSVFLYCLLLLVLLGNSYLSGKPFFISIYLGIFLAIFSFFLLIYFIHYVCNTIQVDYVLDFLTNDTKETIFRVFSKKEDKIVNCNIEKYSLSKPTSIVSTKTGYIQSLDLEKIAELARDADIVIEPLKLPGEFIFKNMVIANIYGQSNYDEIKKCINLNIRTGRRRTTVQDVEFGFEQISEVALRALSPGINNVYTAILCVHRIGELLESLSTVKIPAGAIIKENKLCVFYTNYTYESICGIALNALRQNCFQHVNITIEVLNMIRNVQSLHLPKEMASALDKQAEILFSAAENQQHHTADFQDIIKAYEH